MGCIIECWQISESKEAKEHYEACDDFKAHSLFGYLYRVLGYVTQESK
jgi:hypothetical protein